MRKSAKTTGIVAVAMLAALTLQACGQDKTDTAAESSSTTATSTSTSVESSSSTPETTSTTTETSTETSTTTPTTTTETQAPESKPATPPASTAAKEDADKAKLEAAAKAAAEQLNKAPVKVDPVKGAPAGKADVDAITDLMHRTLWAPDLRSYLTNYLNAMCTRALDKQGGRAALDTSTIPATPMPAEQKPVIDKIANVRVDGDEASADITITVAGHTQTATQRFFKEGGSWKFCD